MIKLIIQISFVGLILSFNACQKSSNTCFKSNGKPIKIESLLNEFATIELFNNINLTIVKDTINKIIIEAPENLIPYIKSDIEKDILFLQNNNKCNWLRNMNIEINATVHTKNLTTLNYRGSGFVINNEMLHVNEFTINIYDGSGLINLNLNSEILNVKLHNGPCDINLSGKTNYLELYNAGEGFMLLQNLKANDVHVRHKGTGNCHVRAINNLEISLEYVGHVFLYGIPPYYTAYISGSGKIYQME